MPTAPSKLKLVKPSLSDLVDRLGRIKAEIADLEKQEDNLRQALIDAGHSEIEGRLFRATVSHFEVKRVNYPELVETLGLAPRTIKRFTIVQDQTQVKVVAR